MAATGEYAEEVAGSAHHGNLIKGVWANQSFANVLRSATNHSPIYTGDDDMAEEEDLDLSNLGTH